MSRNSLLREVVGVGERFWNWRIPSAAGPPATARASKATNCAAMARSPCASANPSTPDAACANESSHRVRTRCSSQSAWIGIGAHTSAPVLAGNERSAARTRPAYDRGVSDHRHTVLRARAIAPLSPREPSHPASPEGRFRPAPVNSAVTPRGHPLPVAAWHSNPRPRRDSHRGLHRLRNSVQPC